MKKYIRSMTESEKVNIATDRNTSVKDLVRFSTDESPYVRWAVAENPNTPKDVLNVLSNDSDRNVAEIATYTLERFS